MGSLLCLALLATSVILGGSRDWDLAIYVYNVSMQHEMESEGSCEDSPQSLGYYRGIYDCTMEKHRMERRGGSEDNFCRMSLLQKT